LSDLATSPFRHRGVVEGFYGPPLSAEDRRWLVERLAVWGMNVYLHAPKDDPRHRARWREPYPAEEMDTFASLIGLGERGGVSVGFAVSPGLSIEYAEAADRAALAAKLASFRAIGARWFALALDDVPSELVHAADRRAFRSLAAAHVAVAHDLAEALGPDVTLWLVPTDYLGTESTPYLEELGADLDPRIEVGWTGRTVVSPTITADEAAARAATLRRPVLVWDNVPVADGPMRPMLHLGPYTGREPGIAASASGVLLNPMERIRASAPALATAARFLADPARYDAESAWREAVVGSGAGAPDAFALFAAAHRYSALAPDDRDRELAAAIAALADALERGRDPAREIADLASRLDARAGVAEALRRDLRDDALRREIEPWIASHATETRRMRAAVRALEAFFGPGSRSQQVLAFIAMEGALSRESSPPQASYGPRRVLYPQLVSMGDDTMRFGDDPVLARGACLADDLVALAERIALDRYSRSGHR
jgi:hyaluronoglucosaminidase